MVMDEGKPPRPPADKGGTGPQSTASGGTLPPLSTASFIGGLTTSETQKLFQLMGVSRSLRSVERYCEHGKLVCTKDEDEGMYYVTRESAEILARQLKEISERHVSTSDDDNVSLTNLF